MMMSDNSLIFLSKNGDEIEPVKKEAFRYMGCKTDDENEELEKLYDECLKEYKKVASYKAVYRLTDVNCKDNTEVKLGFCDIFSEALHKNLSDCVYAMVFAATAGAGVDRLLLRYSKISPAHAVVVSAIASSAVEVWCNEVNAEINKIYATKPRFSPGYGNVSLKYQKDVLAYLDAEKKIGITLSDAFIMTPAKSVTAFVGITEKL